MAAAESSSSAGHTVRVAAACQLPDPVRPSVEPTTGLVVIPCQERVVVWEPGMAAEAAGAAAAASRESPSVGPSMNMLLGTAAAGGEDVAAGWAEPEDGFHRPLVPHGIGEAAGLRPAGPERLRGDGDEEVDDDAEEDDGDDDDVYRPQADGLPVGCVLGLTGSVRGAELVTAPGLPSVLLYSECNHHSVYGVKLGGPSLAPDDAARGSLAALGAEFGLMRLGTQMARRCLQTEGSRQGEVRGLKKQLNHPMGVVVVPLSRRVIEAIRETDEDGFIVRDVEPPRPDFHGEGDPDEKCNVLLVAGGASTHLHVFEIHHPEGAGEVLTPVGSINPQHQWLWNITRNPRLGEAVVLLRGSDPALLLDVERLVILKRVGGLSGSFQGQSCFDPAGTHYFTEDRSNGLFVMPPDPETGMMGSTKRGPYDDEKGWRLELDDQLFASCSIAPRSCTGIAYDEHRQGLVMTFDSGLVCLLSLTSGRLTKRAR